MKQITPPDVEANAKKRVDLLRLHEFDQIVQELDPSLSGPNVRDTLREMSDLFPLEDPKSVKVVNLKKASDDKGRTTLVSLEYEFTSRWLVADIATTEADRKTLITGFHVTPIPEALEKTNALTLEGKGLSQFFGLLLAVGVFLFSLFAFVACLKTNGVRYKWLWCAFTLCGVFKLALNWTTGQWSIAPLSVNIPCAGLTAVPPYAPWTLSIFVPLGAILFFAKYGKNLPAGASQPPPKMEYPPPTAVGD